MHGLDMDVEVRREVPSGADYCGHVAGCERCPSPVIDGHPVLRGEFVPVERGVGLRDYRPCLRMGGGFACEVSRIELREGTLDVVVVEDDVRRNPSVGVDLDDAEHLDAELPVPDVSIRGVDTHERETFTSRREDAQRHRLAKLGEGSYDCDDHIATVPLP